MKYRAPPVTALLKRGDRVEVGSGCLTINAASGIPVPASWMIEHSNSLLLEILTRLDKDALVSESYSTGRYQGKRYGPERYDGVCLQFVSLLSDESRFAIFNAGLDRVKKTGKGGVGSPLPDGHFRVGKRSGFCKFWKMANQPLPPRLSSFHDYMGNLKGTLFTGTVVKGEKLENQSLQLLNITYEQIMEAFFQHNLTHNQHTESIQATYDRHTVTPYNDYAESHAPRGLPLISTTGESNYGKRLTSSTAIRGEVISILSTKKPEDQTLDEWEADLGEPNIDTAINAKYQSI